MDRTGPDSDVEAVLSDALRAHAALAPPAGTLLEAVAAKEIRRRAARRRTALVGAAGVVAAATVSGAVLAGVGAGGGRARPAVAAATARATGVWNFHGLEVRVPRDWAVNAVECGSPVRDTVIVDQGPVAACASVHPPVVQSVELANAPAGAAAPAGSRAVVVDGRPGRLTSGRLPGGLTHETLVVPGLDVSVDVRTTTAGLAAQIIASARVTAVDGNGCASAVDTLRPGGPPQREDSEAQLVPGRPTAAVLCHYTDGRLGHSTRLTDARLTALLPLVNGLRPGLKHSGSDTADWCAAEARDGYVLRFSYATGRPLEVFLRLTGCDRLGADNGARTGGLTVAFGASFTPEFDPGYGSVAAGDLY
jgi:hypothetical protein